MASNALHMTSSVMKKMNRGSFSYYGGVQSLNDNKKFYKLYYIWNVEVTEHVIKKQRLLSFGDKCLLPKLEA